MDNEHNIVEICSNNTRGRVGHEVIEYTGSHTAATLA